MRHLQIKNDEHSSEIVSLLNTIADKTTSVEDYRASFYSIGWQLGHVMKKELPQQFADSTVLACASEDADWLASGVLDGIESPSLPMAIFWGVRTKLSNGTDITSFIRTYKDNFHSNCNTLIIVKSIISSSCVVKTQLMNLISTISPNRIYILAPVMYKDAEANLCREFPIEISSKFKFISFAIDDEINEKHEIVPGIGGMVYPRLGLGDEKQKNSYIPNIVRTRMQAAM